jgi:MFS family permease
MKTFFIIWLGELISVIGSGLSAFALGVWIYQKTGQATPFAITVLFGALPRVLLAPFAGSLADRWNRRLVMIVADCGAAVATVAGAVLLFLGDLQIWHIYTIVLVSSIFSTFQEPAYLASVTMLVPKEQLGRASGMSNLAQSLSIVISPMLAGFLFTVIGLQGIFIIDFVSFFFAVGALLVVRIPQPAVRPEDVQRPSALRDGLLGWRYIRARQGLLGLLIFFAVVNFMVNLAMVLLTPLVLSFTDTRALGLVQAVSGVGMLLGSVAMATWGGPKRRVNGLLGFIALSSLGLMLSGIYPSAAVIGAGIFLLMAFVPLASGSSQAIWQSKVEPSIQGRVFAVRSAIAQVLMPLAFAAAGPLADAIFEPLMATTGALGSALPGDWIGAGPGRGVALIFILGGLGQLLAVLAAWSNPRIRNVERELPDIQVDAEDKGRSQSLAAAPSPLAAD